MELPVPPVPACGKLGRFITPASSLGAKAILLEQAPAAANVHKQANPAVFKDFMDTLP
jgi:hypothetical protein